MLDVPQFDTSPDTPPTTHDRASWWRRHRRWMLGVLAAIALLFAWMAWRLPLDRALEPLPDPTLVLLDRDGTPMRRVTGGGLPARIWRDFMAEALRMLPPRAPLSPPRRVVVAAAPPEEVDPAFVDGEAFIEDEAFVDGEEPPAFVEEPSESEEALSDAPPPDVPVPDAGQAPPDAEPVLEAGDAEGEDAIGMA